MKTIQFKSKINAPVAKVYNTMLGLEDKSTYQAWTAEFNPTSNYEGSWDKGSKINFTGVDDKGNTGGMVSEIEENIPNRFVSIRHIGILQGNKEITEGEDVEKWAGGHENYSFEENNGITTVTVDIDVIEDFEDYFYKTFPKALEKLKSILES